MTRGPARLIITTDTRGLDEMATRAELEKENANLRARLAKYEGGRAPAGPVSFGMSEGVRQEIELAKADVQSGTVEQWVVTDTGTGVSYRVYQDGGTAAVEEYEAGAIVPVETPAATGQTDTLPAE